MTDSIDSHFNNSISENDRFKKNSTSSHTDSKVGENDESENDWSKRAVPENMVKKDSVDEVIVDEDTIDKNEVITEFTENKTKQTIQETSVSMIHPLTSLLH